MKGSRSLLVRRIIASGLADIFRISLPVAGFTRAVKEFIEKKNDITVLKPCNRLNASIKDEYDTLKQYMISHLLIIEFFLRVGLRFP